MSKVELAVEKVKALNESQVEALLDWLALRENSADLRNRLDAEIALGLSQLEKGNKIPSAQVYEEIRERSGRLRESRC